MLITIIVILFLLIGFSLFLASYSYKFKKEPNKYTPAKYGFELEEITIPTKNNKNLYGWWVSADNQKGDNKPTIILIHGWSRNVDRVMSFIKKLHPAGYSLLAFDSRCHGKSDDDKFSSMVKFTEDIISAIDYAETLPNVDKNRFGLLGLSIGGSASINAASMDKRIKTVVTVGAFSHPKKLFGLEFKKRKVPRFPFAWIIFKYMEFYFGAKLNDIAPSKNIAISDASIFLVHGIDDATVPIEQADELYKAGNPNKVKLWKIEGKGHFDCNHHPEFWEKVLIFFKTSL